MTKHIGDLIIVRSNARACQDITVVTGDLLIQEDVSMPGLLSVHRTLNIQASAYLPALTSVGKDMRVYGSSPKGTSIIDLSALAAVQGYASINTQVDVMDCYVVNLNHTTRDDLYISIWRPDDRGYCYALSRAGKYPLETVQQFPNYYNSGSDNVAVPCEVLDAIAVPPT